MAADFIEHVRLLEAMIFASPVPVSRDALAAMLPEDVSVEIALEVLLDLYDGRGVDLVESPEGWAFSCRRTLEKHGIYGESKSGKPLSLAAREVLITIALHQPISSDQLTALRGGRSSRAILQRLKKEGWIRIGGKFQEPGAPQAWVTSAEFLHRLGLGHLDDLPTQEEAREIGAYLRNPEAHDEAGLSGSMRVTFGGNARER